jgi:hypothetical protein
MWCCQTFTFYRICVLVDHAQPVAYTNPINTDVPPTAHARAFDTDATSVATSDEAPPFEFAERARLNEDTNRFGDGDIPTSEAPTMTRMVFTPSLVPFAGCETPFVSGRHGDCEDMAEWLESPVVTQMSETPRLLL